MRFITIGDFNPQVKIGKTEEEEEKKRKPKAKRKAEN